MKCLHVVVTGLTTCCLLAPAVAEEEGQQRRGQAFDREQILKQFDANGDGRLDEAERAKAKESLANRRQGNGNRTGRGRAGKKRSGQAGQGRPNMQALLKQFDKDGDGKLNEQERAAAKEHFTKMRRGQAGNDGGSRRIPEEILKRFDKDGDGKLSQPERAAAMKAREAFMKKNRNAGGGRPNRKEILAKFDKNGDGKLDDSEREAARAAMGKLRAQRGAGAPSTSGAKTRKPRVNKKELLEKFDADGDGKLDDEERAKAREEFQNRKKS